MEIPEEAQTSVEALSWDLTMGAAGNVVGRLFLRTTSGSSSATPESIDHVGIVVYNRLYEYGFTGVSKIAMPRNGENPEPVFPGCKLRKRELLGTTVKSRREFVEWMVNEKYDRFKASSYDMVYHNCIHFAQAVCEFLGVPPLENWTRVSDWIRSNHRLTDCLARGFRVPRPQRLTERSSSLQEEPRRNDPENEVPQYQAVVSPNNPNRRRRFSLFTTRSRPQVRSASMETLPPSYEEALTITARNNERAPKYEDLIPIPERG